MSSTNGGGDAPILAFSSLLPERDTIAIDGTEYELARYHDLSLHKHGKFARVYSRALDLYAELLGEDSDTLSEEDLAFLEERAGVAMADAALLVVRACPREKIDALLIEERMRICQAFQRAVSRWRLGPGAPLGAATPTGGTSSTPSPPATDAAPAGGSGRPASANSSPPIAV